MTQSEFETIAIQLRTKAHDMARRMLSTEDDAEDAAGDVMLRLWDLHDHIKDNDHALKLATVIAHRLSIDIIRKQKTEHSLFADARKGLARWQANGQAHPSGWNWRKTLDGLSSGWRNCHQGNCKY